MAGEHITSNENIIHPRINVVIIRYVQYTPNNVCNRIQEKSIKRAPIFMTNADYDYILDEIERGEK